MAQWASSKDDEQQQGAGDSNTPINQNGPSSNDGIPHPLMDCGQGKNMSDEGGVGTDVAVGVGVILVGALGWGTTPLIAIALVTVLNVDGITTIAKVNVIPGWNEPIETPDAAVGIARDRRPQTVAVGEWLALAEGQFRGLGQRMLATDVAERIAYKNGEALFGAMIKPQ